MKSIAIFIIISGSAFTLYAQRGQPLYTFTIYGKIAGRDTGFVYFSYLNENYDVIKDTARISNGAFSFTGTVAEPCFASLAGNTKSHSADNGDFMVFSLEAGTIQLSLVENKFQQAIITGSKSQMEWEQVNRKQQALSKIYDALIAKQTSQNSIDSLKSLARNAVTQMEVLFIKQHPASYLSPYFLRQLAQLLPLDSARVLFTGLNPQVQNSKIGKIVYTQINGRALPITKGTAPGFARTDINGNDIDLSMFRGKNYIILDFWASWCLPCRKSTVLLKQLYNKYYTAGLDVIAISLDKNEAAWRAAVQKDSITAWHNILSDYKPLHTNAPTESQADILTLYNVTPIPVKILLDKNLNIIARFDGLEDEGKLEEMLKQIFEKGGNN